MPSRGSANQARRAAVVAIVLVAALFCLAPGALAADVSHFSLSTYPGVSPMDAGTSHYWSDLRSGATLDYDTVLYPNLILDQGLYAAMMADTSWNLFHNLRLRFEFKLVDTKGLWHTTVDTRVLDKTFYYENGEYCIREVVEWDGNLVGASTYFIPAANKADAVKRFISVYGVLRLDGSTATRGVTPSQIFEKVGDNPSSFKVVVQVQELSGLHMLDDFTYESQTYEDVAFVDDAAAPTLDDATIQTAPGKIDSIRLVVSDATLLTGLKIIDATHNTELHDFADDVDTADKDVLPFLNPDRRAFEARDLTLSSSGQVRLDIQLSDASGGTRTVSRVVTVPAPSVTVNNLTVAGATQAPESSSTQLYATATFSDGTTADVSGSCSWQTTKGTIASGVLTTPAVSADTACTVTATYDAKSASHSLTIKNITTTLTEIIVSGYPTLGEGVTDQQYVCQAKYSDGSTVTVTNSVTWSASMGVIDASGLYDAPYVAKDTVCTISASYQGKSDSLAVTIVDTQASLQSVNVEGPPSVAEGGTATLTCWANFDDGSRSNVSAQASWSATAGSVSGGSYTAPSVGEDTPVTVSASYQGKSASHQILVTDTAVTLESIEIDGQDAVNENTTSQYTATGYYSNQTTANLTSSATWTAYTNDATISASGLLSTQFVSETQTFHLVATHSGISGSKQVTITNVPTSSTDLYVNRATGSDTTGTGSAASPWKTIAHALDYARGSGSASRQITVHVAAGTYPEAFPLAIPSYTTVAGAGAGSTILDGLGSTEQAFAATGLAGKVCVQDLTIKRFYATHYTRNVVDLEGERFAFTRCEFSGNTGINLADVFKVLGTFVVEDCTFTNNTASRIVSGRTQATITGCSFQGNSTDSYGAVALFPNDGAALLIEDCTFENNTLVDIFVTESDAISASIIVRGCQFRGSGGQSILTRGADYIVQNCTFKDRDATSIHCQGSSTEANMISILDCVFDGNASDQATVYTINTDVEVHRSTFTNNYGKFGALQCSAGNISVDDCTFSGNSNYWYGIATLDLYPTFNCSIRDSVFSANTSEISVLSLVYGNQFIVDACEFRDNTMPYGSIRTDDVTDARVTNCLFEGNTATKGAGIYTLYGALDVRNCTFTGNTATSGGGALYVSSGTASVANSILWNDATTEIGGTATVSYSDVSGGHAGTGNMNVNPIFLGADDFRLSPLSPCVDAGSDALAASGDLDLADRPRKVDGSGSGPGTVDMGAYELSAGADYDGDGLPDDWELRYWGNLLNSGTGNTDDDTLTNAQEYNYGTNPNLADSEGDGMPDDWEIANGLDPTRNDAALDPDQDGKTNLQEYEADTDPQHSDAAPPAPPRATLAPIVGLLLGGNEPGVPLRDYYPITSAYYHWYTNSGRTYNFDNQSLGIYIGLQKMRMAVGGNPYRDNFMKYDESGRLSWYGTSYYTPTGSPDGSCIVRSPATLPAALTPGRSASMNAVLDYYNSNGSYAGSGTSAATVTLTGPMSITVPDGTYTVYKLVQDEYWTSPWQSETGHTVTTYWLAKSVGAVRIDVADDGVNASFELESYIIDD